MPDDYSYHESQASDIVRNAHVNIAGNDTASQLCVAQVHAMLALASAVKEVALALGAK